MSNKKINMLPSILEDAKLGYMNIEAETIKAKAAEAAALLKVLANAERLLILCQLLDGEQCVGILCQKSKLSQSAFSQHLAVLRRDKLVQTRKEAQTVYYSLATPIVAELLQTLQNIYCPNNVK